MNNEEKINELTARIEKLEKAENKRVIKRRIELIWKGIKLLIIVVLIFMAYNYIKPYKEKIDNASEKIDNVEKYINNTFSGFKSYFTK